MVGSSGEKHLLKVVAKYANRYNHSYSSPQVLKRKISILKDIVLVLIDKIIIKWQKVFNP